MVTVLFLGLFCKFFFQKIHLAFWYYLIYLAAVFSQTCSWWLFLFFYILRNKICLCGGTVKPSWYLLLQMWHHVFYKQRSNEQNIVSVSRHCFFNCFWLRVFDHMRRLIFDWKYCSSFSARFRLKRYEYQIIIIKWHVVMWNLTLLLFYMKTDGCQF